MTLKLIVLNFVPIARAVLSFLENDKANPNFFKQFYKVIPGLTSPKHIFY